MSVRVQLLGPPRVVRGGEETPIAATLPGALLVYLASRGTWVSRDELALVFKPDVADAEARRALRKLIFRARAVAYASELEVHGERLRWRVPCDLLELRAAVADGAWETAATIDFAPPFEGFSLPAVAGFEAWLDLERQDATAVWRRALLSHADAFEAAGDLAGAANALERVLDHEPLDEPVVQEVLRIRGAAGDRNAALAAYGRFAARLEAELGATPLDATMALVDALEGVPERPSAASGARGWRGPVAVPRTTTSFVGRTEDLVRLGEMLASDEGRLVSLVGLGGVGKTRLALEVAARSRSAFPGGVVELALAGAAGQEPLAFLADALGVGAGDVDAVARLAQRFGGTEHTFERSCLLLLDGADAVGDQTGLAEVVRDLLAAAPSLRILLTARQPLGLAQEQVVPLSGLEFPEAGSETLRDSPAVRLFLDRASRADPGIVDDDATLAAAGALCRSLGGHPLAIELAAAWTRSLPLSSIVRELERGQDLLRTEAPDVPERHRSVRALVERAWRDLDDRGRDALTALLAFRGAWSLDAAQEVAGADLHTVFELVARSLLRRRGADRFEVHELVRAGAEGEPGPGVLDRHAQHVLGSLARLHPGLRSGSADAAADAAALLPDLASAWWHAIDRREFALLESALAALDAVVHARSLWGLARELYAPTARALGDAAGADATLVRALRARLLTRAAGAHRNVGDTDRARELVHDALDTAPPRGRAGLEARLELAKLDDQVAAYPAAASGYRSILADLAAGDDDLAADAHGGLANVLFATGDDPAAALEHAERALGAARRSGDLDLTAIALINLGAGHYDLGQLGAAEARWREAATATATLGHRWREASVLANLAALAERRGDRAAARDAYERALVVRRELGDGRGIARTLLHLGRLALADGDPVDADVRLECAVTMFERVDAPADLAWAVATHARVRLELGDHDGGARRIERALRLGRLAGDETSMLAGLLGTAMLHAMRGDDDAAAEMAGEVAALAAGRADGVRASAEEYLGQLASRTAAHGRPPPPRGRTAAQRDLGARRARLQALVEGALDVAVAPLRRWNAGGTRAR